MDSWSLPDVKVCRLHRPGGTARWNPLDVANSVSHTGVIELTPLARWLQEGIVMTERHYRQPGWFTKNVANKLVALLTRSGLSIMGSRVLEVKGRKSGLPRRTPVNLLSFEGAQYLVSARGEGEWVRNVRADEGQLDLLLGSKRQHYRAQEVGDDGKVQILR